MANEVEQFYDVFSQRYIKDYVQGNARVRRQITFFSDAIPTDTQSILVIGCGSGESALHLVTRVAPQAHVLAVDLSAQSVAMAQKLFPHERITYKQVDVIKDNLVGQWDVIAMPDVLEHIPVEAREAMYDRFNQLLSSRGRVLITCPAPNSRRSRRREAGELQIIDEDVTVDDLRGFASATGTRLSFYRLVSIWHPNDYFHAMLEREPDVEAGLSVQTATPIKGHRRITSWQRFVMRVRNKLRLNKLAEKRRAGYIKRRMQG